MKRASGDGRDQLYILTTDDVGYLIKEFKYGRRAVILHAAHRLGAVAESG